MTVGSLFSGIGGFDLGLERAGMRVAWQIEIDPACNRVLARHWPDVPRYRDIRELTGHELPSVDVLCGGDPCPHRSRARTIHGSKHADLWPDFIRLVRVMRPVWVLREHVVSDDVDECWSALVHAGYSAAVLEADSAQVTGQSRPREYLAGVLATTGLCPGQVFDERRSMARHAATGRKAQPVGACLTTHPWRFDSRDNYLCEPEGGTRILAAIERERLQGFPDGWTDSLPDRARARVLGNAVTVPVAEHIGRCIMES